jgi:hypothetical protein
LVRESVDLAQLVEASIAACELETQGREVKWAIARLPVVAGGAAHHRASRRSRLGRRRKREGRKILLFPAEELKRLAMHTAMPQKRRAGIDKFA